MTWNLDLVLYMLAFVGAGVFSGFFSGLFGIGGGILRVPVFLFLFSRFGAAPEVVMHMATGTSLALVVPGSIMSSWQMHKLGHFDFQYFKTWAVACVIGVLVGLVVLNFVTTFYLELLFVIFLFSISIYVWFARPSLAIAKAPPRGVAKWVTSGGIGGFSVLIGIGGGAFTGPILKACSMRIKDAIAVAGATALVIGTVGAIGAVITGWNVAGRPYSSIGYVDFVVFIVVMPVVMVLAPLGAKAAHALDRTLLKRVYSVFLVLMSLYMLSEMLGWL
jgi:uncharacterized membrane protein YfcA